MQFRYPLAAALAVLVVAGALAGPLGTVAAQEAAPANGTVTVSGSGEASAAPDTATVYFAVVATDSEADVARETVADATEAVRAALDDADFDAPETRGYSLSPVYDDGRYDERTVTGYRVSHRLSVETTPERAGELVDTVVGAGATEVSGVSFGLSDAASAEVRAEALRDAMAAAGADAAVIADAADGTLGDVRSVSTGYGGPVVPYERAVAGDAGGSTVLTPGDVSVSASVTVTYDLE